MLNGVLQRFVNSNVAISWRLLPSVAHRQHAYEKYAEQGTALLKSGPKRVLDVGAGRQWHFPPALKHGEIALIGFDIDMEEMRQNTVLDERIAGDACKGLGVPDGSVDLIMAQAVIEHLYDTASFLKNANRALRDDGRLIVTFASRYAPFAILNRALPRRVTERLLAHLVPGSSGVLGFKAYYDRASYAEFKESLLDAGFEIEHEHASYFSCAYFAFFVPLFLIALGLDYLRYLCGIPNLASYFMFVARKSRSS
jgi:SAM-dependent methyltransferase